MCKQHLAALSSKLHSANIAIEPFPLAYLFIRYAVISSPGILSRATDTWNILGQYGELRLDVKAAPEPQEGKTVFVFFFLLSSSSSSLFPAV